MLEHLLTFFLKQAGDVSSRMNPAQTAAQLIEMWQDGKETGAEAADAITGPGPGDTNAWDFLVTLVEHVGPNVGEQLGNLLALAMMRGGNNGDESQGPEHAADGRHPDQPTLEGLESRRGGAAHGERAA